MAVMLTASGNAIDSAGDAKDGVIDSHRDVTSVDQVGVVCRPVPHAVPGLRCAPAHLLETGNREFAQEPEVLTGPPDRVVVRQRQPAACPPD